jgi:uncharacterized repeat protein (TIGR01451 family)
MAGIQAQLEEFLCRVEGKCAPEPEPPPPPDCVIEGDPFECNDSRGCIRIEVNGSFEYSGGWDADVVGCELRRIHSFYAVTVEMDTITVRPCHGLNMYAWNPSGFVYDPACRTCLIQELDISRYGQHISDRSKVVVEALFNHVPVIVGLLPVGFDVNIRAFRDGEVVAETTPDFYLMPRIGSRDDPSVWDVDSKGLHLLTGTDKVEVKIEGALARDNIIFLDDVRVWLMLNAPDAELALTKTVDRSNALIGQPVTFTLTVTNLGTEAASDVRILDTPPPQLRYDSHSGDGGYLPSDGLWIVGAVEAGQSATLTINTTVITPERIGVINSAEIVGGLVGDFNAADNLASVSVRLNGLGPPPASEDIIAYYPFDGNAADLSGNDNHGTVFGANLTTDRFNLANRAYSFDGVDDFIDIGNDSSLKPPLPISISAWVQLDAPDPLQAIITNNFQENVYLGADFNISDGKVAINYGDGGAVGPASRRSKIGTTVLQPQQWYHVVGIIRGSTDMDIYVNATNDGGTYSGTGDALAYNNGPGAIGKNANLKYFHGAIDDILVYKRALSADEVFQLFQGGGSPSAAPNAGISDRFRVGTKNQ